mmetsp:Transcript_112274/g.317341  ORF Transcript_112274/g.317341 Transcript_112274/m.317341 type:complete len:138 (-) Transcript_112274:118-531(-)
MSRRAFLVLALLPGQALAGIFGPPKFVQEACKKWCDQAAADGDSVEACNACKQGPQTNPKCTDEGTCDYCEREITFPRHYPKLWREEPSFNGKMAKLEGRTRCWCDTGCPVYSLKSRLFCNRECSAVCNNMAAAVIV